MASNSSRSKYYNVTVDGISLRIPKDVIDDIEVVELLSDVQDGNIFSFAKLARRMFGEEGYQKVKDSLADKDGRTRVTDMSDFLIKVFKACNALEAKN